MSVDIAQLTARLDSDRRDAVKQQYEERATNPTAAFLLCFFLGFAGAHRFYLHEWRSAFGHLALFALGAAALGAGLTQTLPLTTSLTTHPLGATLDAIGLALLLASLIWEIIDLSRVDHQVYHRNLLLAEGIIAATLLADPSVVEHARQTANEVARQTHAQPSTAAPAALAGAGAAAGAGVITASEVADARALADETGGYSSISYTEVSRFDVSADPDQARQASADAAREGNWAESITTAELQPGASASAEPETLIETMTRAHTEDGERVTDSYEVDRRTEPSAAEWAGLGAAGLAAAGLGAAALNEASGAGFDEPTQPDIATSAAPEPPAYEPYQQPYEPYEPYKSAQPLEPGGVSAYDAPTYAPAPAPEAGEALAAQPASYARDGYDFEDEDVGDVTDHSMPAVVIPPADVAMPNASPAYVQLDDAASAPAVPASPEAPEAPLYLIPDEPATAAPDYGDHGDYGDYGGYASYDAPSTEQQTEEPPAEAYVPPVAPVFSPPAAEPAAPRASWESPTEPAYDYGYGATGEAPAPSAEPAAAPHGANQGSGETLAELAGFAGLAGAGAVAGEALAHHQEHQEGPAPEPAAAEPTPAPAPMAAPGAAEPAAPAPPKMKKIRVRRQVVLDGKVVDEIVVEREVPADMDSAEAAAKIQEELSHFTPEEIAQRAHLAPNEEIELRQRNQGQG